MENSKIQWTDHTFNPWWGCMKVSPGCKNCYAELLDKRFDGGHWGPSSTRKPMSEKYWKQPIAWNKSAQRAGVKAKVFCASMADVFEGHPDTIDHLNRLFKLIEATPFLIWQLLTKRPENILKLVPTHWHIKFPDNVWIGTSVENQEMADVRIPALMKINSSVRFLSCEPLLGDINFESIKSRHDGIRIPIFDIVDDHYPVDGFMAPINWVIVGGESGAAARPAHPDWVKNIKDQCESHNVAMFFKQWGEWWPGDKGRLYREKMIDFSDGQTMVRMGKQSSGNLLNGKTYMNFPKY